VSYRDTDQKLIAEVEQTLAALGNAYLKGDRRTIDELFSYRALASYIVDAGIMEPEKKFAHRLIAMKFRERLSHEEKVNGFSQLELRDVQRISSTEVIAFTEVYRVEYESFHKMRWWLIQDKDGKWAAYDYENLKRPYRFSHFMGEKYVAERNGQDWLLPWVRYSEIYAEFDYPEICKMVESLLLHDLPPAIELEALIFYPHALHMEDRLEDAIEAATRKVELAGGDPVMRLDRAYYHQVADNDQLAIEDAQSHADTFGWSVRARKIAMKSHASLGNIAEAVARRGIAGG